MRRRDFLRFTGLAVSAAALPVLAQPPLPLVVWLSYADEKTVGSYFNAVQNGLRSRGLVDGQTIRLETYYAQFSKERVQQLIPEIIAKNPAVVVVQGAAIKPMTEATKTIPLVVASSGDMVVGKLVTSLARPGGNVTGVQFLAIDLVGKRMELLKEINPRLKHVAVIADPGHAGETNERARTLAAAKQLGIRVDYKPVTNPAELQAALDSTPGSGVEAIVAFPDSITFGPRKRIADFAIQHKLPTVSGWDAYADAGFLLIYGPSMTASYERMAYFVERILKGTKPADLPAEIPSVIETVVNLKTAKALGIELPQTVLLRANRVIE
jgi:putative tryptophan/tyrosine transport system substrate-binding protein